MTRLIFVRHGETAHHAGLVISSRPPGCPLTERGVGQATELAQTLVSLKPAAIYSSPLLRARQTAAILAAACRLDVNLLDDLRECDAGDLEGHGDERSFARFNATFDHWYLRDHLDFPLGPAGESGRSGLARIRRMMHTLDRTHPDHVVVVVGHATVLQLALTRLCDNLPADFGYGRWISNAGTVVIDSGALRTTCLSWDGSPMVQTLESPAEIWSRTC